MHRNQKWRSGSNPEYWDWQPDGLPVLNLTAEYQKTTHEKLRAGQPPPRPAQPPQKHESMYTVYNYTTLLCISYCYVYRCIAWQWTEPTAVFTVPWCPLKLTQKSVAGEIEGHEIPEMAAQSVFMDQSLYMIGAQSLNRGKWRGLGDRSQLLD